jgi:hypothetical protein
VSAKSKAASCGLRRIANLHFEQFVTIMLLSVAYSAFLLTIRPTHPLDGDRAMLRLSAMLMLAALAVATPQAQADTLLIERVNAETGMTLPARGMRMADVERKFGVPSQRLEPRGGESRRRPTINRWTYPNFIVYFEKDRVIDAVAIRANQNEVGPKSPIR